MNISLRSALLGLWLLIVVVCVALAVQMAGLFRLGVGAETHRVQEQVERSRDSIAQRFAVYASGIPEGRSIDAAEKQRTMNVIADLVLNDFNAVEGGFWDQGTGFLAYSFPTYEGGTAKRDIPAAEKERIEAICRDAVGKNSPQEKRFEGIRETLILAARPASAGGPVVWTMSRAHVAAAAAYQKLTVGFAVLFTFALASGGAVLWLLQRWSRRVERLEDLIADAPVDELPALPQTGQKELDRIVGSLNLLSARLRESRERSGKLGKDLARAERVAALGRMAAEVAHEIRNPIAAIRLRAENALAKTDAHRAGALEFIVGEILRLDDLLARLLTIAHLDEINRRPVELRTWLLSRVEHFREQAAQQQVTIVSEAPEAACAVDEKKMGRALDNLLLNALQYVSPGGMVSVRVERSGDFCRITVENSGVKIPPEKREEIFEPLASGRDGGTGLGLSIAREIVEAHGGSLRCVESESGARFEIEFPWLES